MNQLIGQLQNDVQKLTAALYRVTELMSDREPIKWTLRDKAIDVLNGIMSIRQGSNNYNEIMSFLDNIRSIFSLFSVGIYVSKRNFEILDREYEKLKDILEKQKDNLITDNNILLPEIDPKTQIYSLENIEREKDFLNKSLLIGQNNKKDFFAEQAEQKENKNETLNSDDDRKTRQISGNSKVLNSERREKLLLALKNEGAKTAGELSVLVPDVSSKTIQRDLIELIQNGLIQAKGEKRWRKYYLAGLDELGIVASNKD